MVSDMRSVSLASVASSEEALCSGGVLGLCKVYDTGIDVAQV